MTLPLIAFFNNKGGVGKTSLVYHLSWMCADLGHRVLVADLDPQANLTAACIDEDRLEMLWTNESPRRTIFGAVNPLVQGVGDVIDAPHVEVVDENLHLLAGDLALSRFEDELSSEWPRALDRKERAFRVLSALWRVTQGAGRTCGAEVVFVDLGPNLGAINRAALVASDFLVVPLVPDLFSLQGLRNLGPTLKDWRSGWEERRAKNPDDSLELPPGRIEPIGYVVMQRAVRLDRPTKAYERWSNRIPEEYAREVAGDETYRAAAIDGGDPHCVGLVKHYRSLMPMAQEARKPMFHLTSADGAIGAHSSAVADARGNFESLAREILWRCGVPVRTVAG